MTRNKSGGFEEVPLGEAGWSPALDRPTVPRRPGVYIFRDAREKVLYVGKARDLRSRMGSYFQEGARLDPRKARMVRLIRDFSYVVTGSEIEALALEANLIKQYRPRFNILLRDDKSYPYLRLSVQEEWPRLEVVRRVKRDGARYWGPYVPSGAMWETLDFIRKNFGIRLCRYNLDRPMRPCIQHQMGRCPAPCGRLIEHDRYIEIVREVELFLGGRKKQLLDALDREMRRAADEERFEDAARMRDRLGALRMAFEAQKVVAPGLGDLDVIALHAPEGGAESEGGANEAVFQVFFVKAGTMVGARDFRIRDVEGLGREELMHGFVEGFYSRGVMPSAAIAVNVEPEERETLEAWLSGLRGGRVTIHVPMRGRRAGLLAMALENARIAHEARHAARDGREMRDLALMLGLPEVPESAGAFDVSNVSGAEAVGAFVFFEGGAFHKERYRHLRIESVTGADDYAMMRETVGRVLGDPEAVPDVVVIDGGRGHLEAARGVVDRMARAGAFPGGDPPTVISVAKDPDRAFTLEGREMALDVRRPAGAFLTRLRDEVHRFAVSYHRKLRGRRALDSPLLQVPGIGKKRRLALLRALGSVDAVRRASVEDLAAVPGMNRPAAEALRRALDGPADPVVQ